MLEGPYRRHRRAVERIQALYPLGLDDPALPDDLALVASRERYLRTLPAPAPLTSSQVARVVELIRTGRP